MSGDLGNELIYPDPLHKLGLKKKMINWDGEG